MSEIMAYSDKWSVTPGETMRFMVSCPKSSAYQAEIVRLKQPEAGPLGTPFAQEPVDAQCNGRYSGRYQPIPIGSFAVVSPHPAIPVCGSFTIAAYIYPTTPFKGRQAIVGTWSEALQTGYGLEIGADGAISFRMGSGPGRVTIISSAVKLSARRWYLIAAAFDAENGHVTLWQDALPGQNLHPDHAAAVTATAEFRPGPGLRPLTFAAWNNGHATACSAWGGFRFTCHFNGRIDRPRLARRAFDRGAIGMLVSAPHLGTMVDCVVGAWDFGKDITTDEIRDLGPWRLNGVIVNQPTRAVPGHNWNGSEMDWRKAPEQYGAIHFHDDDLVDACWESDFGFPVPLGLRSGIYAAKLTSDDFEFCVPFFVRPPRGEVHSCVAFLASTATYTAYLNTRDRHLTLATERLHGRLTVMDAIDLMLVEFPEMGLSTYDRHSDGTGVAYSSRLRPERNFRPTGRHWNFNVDLFIIDWLERLGGDYDVITD